MSPITPAPDCAGFVRHLPVCDPVFQSVLQASLERNSQRSIATLPIRPAPLDRARTHHGVARVIMRQKELG